MRVPREGREINTYRNPMTLITTRWHLSQLKKVNIPDGTYRNHNYFTTKVGRETPQMALIATGGALRWHLSQLEQVSEICRVSSLWKAFLGPLSQAFEGPLKGLSGVSERPLRGLSGTFEKLLRGL